MKEKDEQLLDRVAQRLASNLEKRFSSETLKALGETTFEGTTNLADTER